MKKTLKAAVAALALLATPALADTTDLYTSGAWTVFGGTSTSGQPVCGMEEHGRSSVFALKWFSGDTRLTVHFFTTHRYPDGSHIPVEVRFDANTPWSAQARAMAIPDGSGTVLEFYINPAADKNAVAQFLTEMHDSQMVRFSFPSTDMGDVLGDLTGTAASLNVFGDCISYVKHHVPPATGTSAPVAPHHEAPAPALPAEPPTSGRDRSGTYL